MSAVLLVAGIGVETARDLAKRGARVILACRNRMKAQAVAGEDVFYSLSSFVFRECVCVYKLMVVCRCVCLYTVHSGVTLWDPPCHSSYDTNDDVCTQTYTQANRWITNFSHS